MEEGDQGMISLDGPNGTLRVVLIQRLLLLPSRCRRPSPAVAHGEQTAGRSSGSNGLSTTERAALRKASDTTRMGSSRQVGSAESSGGVPVTEAITATREMPMLHPVLLGLAALARKSTSPSGHETNSHSGANSLDPSRGRISDHLSGGSNRTARSVATNGTEGQEEWFSARELQVSGDDLSVSEERRINLDSGALGRHPEASPASETRCSESHGEIRSVPGGSGNADIEAARLKVEQQLGLGAKDLGEQSKEDFAGKAGMGLSSQHSADSSVKSIVGGGPAVESDGKHQNEGVDGVLEGPDGVFNGAREGSPESAPHGSDVVSGSPAQVGSGIGEREEKARRPSTTPAVTCTSVERPFGMLEVFMLGNANGPLKAAPNRYEGYIGRDRSWTVTRIPICCPCIAFDVVSTSYEIGNWIVQGLSACCLCVVCVYDDYVRRHWKPKYKGYCNVVVACRLCIVGIFCSCGVPVLLLSCLQSTLAVCQWSCKLLALLCTTLCHVLVLASTVLFFRVKEESNAVCK